MIRQLGRQLTNFQSSSHKNRLLETKREAVSSGANKLRNGIFKIDDTQEKVKDMSEELVESQKQVKLVQDDCNVCIINLSAETEVLDKQKKIVEEQGDKIAVEEVEIGIKRELAQKGSKFFTQPKILRFSNFYHRFVNCNACLGRSNISTELLE